MSKIGRWTQVEPTKLFVGAEGGQIPPPKKSTWKTVAIVCGIAAGIYLLAPGTTHYLKHGELPPERAE